jgi:hypothetical protein
LQADAAQMDNTLQQIHSDLARAETESTRVKQMIIADREAARQSDAEELRLEQRRTELEQWLADLEAEEGDCVVGILQAQRFPRRSREVGKSACKCSRFGEGGGPDDETVPLGTRGTPHNSQAEGRTAASIAPRHHRIERGQTDAVAQEYFYSGGLNSWKCQIIGRSAFRCGEQKNDVGPAPLALRRETGIYVAVPLEKFRSTFTILMQEGQVTFACQKMEFEQCDFRGNWTILLM